MYSVVFILSMISLVYAQKAPCFQFPGHTFLEFKPNNMNISHKVHYSLMLKTKSPEGVVLYAEGPEDYEAVYLREGRLVYLLTNPSPSGVEGTSGGIYVTTDPVNNGNWLEVDVWRNWEPEEEHYHQQKELRTGLRVRDTATGTEESHLDDLLHRGVRFNDTVYFGGVISTARHTKGSASPDFVGQIREMHEEGSDVDFELYSLNFVGKVTPCS